MTIHARTTVTAAVKAERRHNESARHTKETAR
jgi:hypothetical protein